MIEQHLASPRNFGALPHANAVGQAGAMRWGDALKLMLQIDPASDVIAQARFQAFGCGSAIASSSAITEMVTGKTTDEALRITAADIAAFLGGLPPEQMYCAVMGHEALRIAIANFRAASGSGAQPAGIETALLCKCFGVREDMVERAIRVNRLTEPEQVTSYTKAGRGCIACFRQIEGVLARLNGEMARDGVIGGAQAYRVGSADPRMFEIKPRGDGPAGPKVSFPAAPVARPAPPPGPGRPAMAAPAGQRRDAEKISLIQHAIDDLRPHLQRDGGDCELLDVDGNTVFIKLSGSCVDCQLSSVTLSGVQARLADKLGSLVRVVSVQ